ncbi:hypothetical protein [Streptomyces sp. NPDC047070]|uniref:TetR/AcrR family transcriptional regulator n=1 Tax=Streptomyces sp. NPDC047070 TaxID=3154923 RepID=UPI003453D302
MFYCEVPLQARRDSAGIHCIGDDAVGSPQAGLLDREEGEQSAHAYRAVPEGPDVDERVDLLGAVLLGVTFSRYVVRSGALATMNSELVIQHLADLIRPIVQPQPSSPTAER